MPILSYFLRGKRERFGIERLQSDGLDLESQSGYVIVKSTCCQSFFEIDEFPQGRGREKSGKGKDSASKPFRMRGKMWEMKHYVMRACAGRQLQCGLWFFPSVQSTRLFLASVADGLVTHILGFLRLLGGTQFRLFGLEYLSPARVYGQDERRESILTDMPELLLLVVQ